MEFLVKYGGLIALVLGVFARMVIPWLLLVYAGYRNKGDKPTWQWRYLAGQLVGVVILLVGLPVLVGDLADVLAWDWQAAWLAGYGAAEIGRLGDKELTGHGK